MSWPGGAALPAGSALLCAEANAKSIFGPGPRGPDLLEWRADGTRAPPGAAPSPAENAIAKAMDELCKDMYNFRVYAFPPPKMKKG